MSKISSERSETHGVLNEATNQAVQNMIDFIRTAVQEKMKKQG